MLDLEELPEAYGVDKVEVLFRDPYTVFAYWEITQEGLDGARAQLGERERARLVLRLFTTEPGEQETYTRNINLDGLRGRCYLPAPRPGVGCAPPCGLLAPSGCSPRRPFVDCCGCLRRRPRRGSHGASNGCKSSRRGVAPSRAQNPFKRARWAQAEAEAPDAAIDVPGVEPDTGAATHVALHLVNPGAGAG